MRRTEGNFPVTPAQRLAKLVKGAVVQEFDDEFFNQCTTGQPLEHLTVIAAQAVVAFFNVHMFLTFIAAALPKSPEQRRKMSKTVVQYHYTTPPSQ